MPTQRLTRLSTEEGARSILRRMIDAGRCIVEDLMLWNGEVIAHTAEPVRRMLWQTRQDFISQRNLEAIAQRNASDAAASEG